MKKLVAKNKELIVGIIKGKAEDFKEFRNLSVTRGGVLIANYQSQKGKVESVLIQKSDLDNDKLYVQFVDAIRKHREANSGVEAMTQKLDFSGWLKQNKVKA